MARATGILRFHPPRRLLVASCRRRARPAQGGRKFERFGVAFWNDLWTVMRDTTRLQLRLASESPTVAGARCARPGQLAAPRGNVWVQPQDPEAHRRWRMASSTSGARPSRPACRGECGRGRPSGETRSRPWTWWRTSLMSVDPDPAEAHAACKPFIASYAPPPLQWRDAGLVSARTRAGAGGRSHSSAWA